MKNMKYNITFWIVLVCAMLFSTCENIPETFESNTQIENGYGRISISLLGMKTESQADKKTARTVFPSAVFDKYVYTFTKLGETTGVVKAPDDNGFFTLEVGSYTVMVQTYTGKADPYDLSAIGVSEQFSVGSGNNSPVEVVLNTVSTETQGEFNYTINYPVDAVAEITLQKWPELDSITLNPVDITQGNGKTQTLQLETGSYLFTVLISKTGLYAGISEAVHIYPSLSTVYIKNYIDDDLVDTVPPTVNDYNISGTGIYTYDGNAKTASVTRKDNVSTGAITILYNGTTVAPVNAGTYTVTFNVAAAIDFSQATGLSAGTIVINKATGAAVNAPTSASSITNVGITLDPVTAPDNGQTVEYSINTVNTIPSNWQDSTTFSGLTANTTYYFFARSVENDNYNVGEASDSLSITTLQTVSTDRIEYYWVNEHSDLVTTSGGATTVLQGKILTITPQGTGYTVQQWYLDGVNTGQSGDTYDFLSTAAGKHTVVLFVEKNGKLYNTKITITVEVSYTVTFYINGGSGTVPDSQIVNPGSSITLPNGSAFTRTGYTFGGWNTNSSSTGTNYNAGVSYTPTGNITLYARWNCTVTFSNNNGSGTVPSAQTVVAGSSITLPSSSGLTRAGYTFGGWNTNTSGTGTDYNVGASYTPTGNITLYAKWNCTVTFNANNGSGTVPSVQIVSAGSSITLPDGSGLTRSGYIFDGWNTNTGGTGTNYNAGASYTPIGNITLYARWINYTVTFSANSGSGTIPTPQIVNPGSSITLPDGSGLTRTGYTFGGWNTNSSGTGTNYNAGESYTPTGNITLYVKWNTVYTVTFNINGGSGTVPAPQIVNPGSSITLPGGSGLTRTNYIFNGWSTNTSGTGTNYNAGESYTPTGNITLYARWIASYTVTFNANSGSGTVAAQTVATGSSITLPDGSGLSRTGYTFNGWNTNTSGTGTNYNVGASYTPTGNITLYARWGYSVTFNVNEGSGTAPLAQIVNPGSSITLPDESGMSRDGYIFDGWNTNSSGTGTNYNAGSSYTVNGSVTLYARWINYTVTFSANGGSGTVPAAQSALPGSSITLPDGSGLNRDGYIFGGWNTNSSGTGTNYNAGASYTPTGNITLYAKWNYNVTFSANGGSGTIPDPEFLSANYMYLPSGSGLSKTGYTFGGWNTEPDGTGTNYNAGSFYSINNSITLYARWHINGSEAAPFLLTENIWINGDITSSDGDSAVWYSINTIAIAGAAYNVWWNDSKNGDNTKTLDVKVTAYNSSGTNMGFFTDIDSGWVYGEGFEYSSGSGNAQIIKIKVTPYTSGSTGTFAIVYSTGSTRP